jgi:hypothetical protein
MNTSILVVSVRTCLFISMLRLVSTGDPEMTIRYDMKEARPLDLLVDGSKKHTFPCSGTGDWANWNTEKIVLFEPRHSYH